MQDSESIKQIPSGVFENSKAETIEQITRRLDEEEQKKKKSLFKKRESKNRDKQLNIEKS